MGEGCQRVDHQPTKQNRIGIIEKDKSIYHVFVYIFERENLVSYSEKATIVCQYEKIKTLSKTGILFVAIPVYAYHGEYLHMKET